MIHFPSPMMASQNVPVQTSQNAFYPFQQPVMAPQQMQTNPSNPYPMNLQDNFKLPFYQLPQGDAFIGNQQHPPFFQLPVNFPAPSQVPPNYGQLPQSVLDQIRNCVSSAAPIFILPGGCQQPGNQQQTNLAGQPGGAVPLIAQPAGFNCPPAFYPYPIPVPVFDSLSGQSRSRDAIGRVICACCQKRGQDSLDWKNHPVGCCCNANETEEHRCTRTNDGTVCGKKNCPVAISLQSLASQLLSVTGIISCATTRLILAKVPGSNITNTMEDTMDKAQRSISALTKDQLLAESRSAQQVNALISLHMTTNPPVNVIPLLTLLQIKVNVLKALVESLINKKVMECQGYGTEVETSAPIDPCVLATKTNAELRQLLAALRQKECDERVNVNFSPYHSQRVIAESRLSTVQAKIRQVEAEFDRRRCTSLPTSTLTSRVIQQFAESTCTFGYAHANIFEPYVQGSALDSPDPFEQQLRNPKRLYLKPREAEQRPWPVRERDQAVGTGEDDSCPCKDAATGEGKVNSSVEKAVDQSSSVEDCSCGGSSSQDSFDEDKDKKKLRLRIDRKGTVKISRMRCLKVVSVVKLGPNARLEAKDTSERDGGGEDVKEKPGDGKEPGETRVEADKEAGRRDEQFRDPEDKLRDIEGEDNGDNGGMVEVKEESEDESSGDEDNEGENDEGSDEEDDDDDDDDDNGNGATLGGATDRPRVEVKIEPQSPKKEKTSNTRLEKDKDIEIEKKARNGEKGRGTKALNSTEMEEEEISEGVILVTKKPITIELDTSASSEELVLNEVDLEKRGDKEAEKRNESTSVSTETVLPGEGNGGESKGNSKSNGVSKDREIHTERGLQSADAREVVFEVQLAPTGNNLEEEQQQVKKIDPNEPGVDPEDESSSKDNKSKNVHFVSMMTRVEYDRRFEEFWEWNEKDASSMSTARQDGKICENIISKNYPMNDGKTANGIGQFPPLRSGAPTATGTRTTRISENVFHQNEIESGCLEFIRNRSSSYERDSETGTGIVSAIYSIIENRLVSASSFLANISNLPSVIQNFRSNKLSPGSRNNNNNNNNNNSNNHADGDDSFVEKNSRNKNAVSEKSDWMFLPSHGNAPVDDKRDTSAVRSVPVGVEFVRTRKIKRSIIVDEERRKYSLIGGSSSAQLRELSRNGFAEPRETRKSLLIRSRLKNPSNSQDENLCPLTILKRAKRSRFATRNKKRGDLEAKGDGKFSTCLSKISEDSFSRTTDSCDQTEKLELSENGQGTEEFAKLSANEMVERCSDKDDNNNRTTFTKDRSIDERVRR